MDLFHPEKLLPSIQLSITPVILISGLGALMISMTNRMARVVDRSRAMAGQVRTATGAERAALAQQLRIMFARAGIVRRAVTCNALSMFFSGLLVVTIFLGAILGADFAALILCLFTASVAAMIAGLFEFIRDIFLSLNALQLEVERALGPQE